MHISNLQAQVVLKGSVLRLWVDVTLVALRGRVIVQGGRACMGR